MVAPVTKAAPQPLGSLKRSSNQLRATCSSCAVAGVGVKRPEFWSQAPASQLAARVTGMAPPITNPKKREPAIAIVAGEQISSSTPITLSSGVGSRLNGSSSVASRATASGEGATPRSSSASRYEIARCAAFSKSFRIAISCLSLCLCCTQLPPLVASRALPVSSRWGL